MTTRRRFLLGAAAVAMAPALPAVATEVAARDLTGTTVVSVPITKLLHFRVMTEDEYLADLRASASVFRSKMATLLQAA